MATVRTFKFLDVDEINYMMIKRKKLGHLIIKLTIFLNFKLDDNSYTKVDKLIYFQVECPIFEN